MAEADTLADVIQAKRIGRLQAFAAGATAGLDAQLELERDLQREAGATPDYREGVAAFLEKRPPRFTGQPG